MKWSPSRKSCVWTSFIQKPCIHHLTSMEHLIQKAFNSRENLIKDLHHEQTNTYRLFHGANEGLPGLTIDLYGNQILIQTFYEPLSETQKGLLRRFLTERLDFIPDFHFKDRSSSRSSSCIANNRILASDKRHFSSELGIRYLIKATQQGQDPYLFLDMRATRRYILKNSHNLSVLNLFAYTCSLGLCAALGGASEVWNIDFAQSALDVGKINLEENQLTESAHRMIREDFFPAVRQLAGLSVKGRGRRKKHQKFALRTFDMVLLDPPRWATSSFGAVDLVRDYQSVFKPALLVTKPGGKLICTNHVPAVRLSDWLEILQRCADKNNIAIDISEIITPEKDFPSPDGQHPLKIAVIDRK